MPLIKTTTAVAAGATVFPWQGNQYEFLPFDAVIEVAIVENTAAAQRNVIGTVYSGTDVLMQEATLDYGAVTGLAYPDDYSLQDVGGAGERLGCQLTNPDANAATVLTAVRITPL